jgi:DNA-binding response OmpR family regulator
LEYIVTSPHSDDPARAMHQTPEGRLSGYRVLVVEDDEDVRDSVVAAMLAEGADVMGVGDGDAAIHMCAEGEPDLVILDMMLPNRSGFLVLEKIKGYEDSPVVIMMTANEGKRHQAYAESQGVDDYLVKPVPLERLIERSLELLRADDQSE